MPPVDNATVAATTPADTLKHMITVAREGESTAFDLVRDLSGGQRLEILRRKLQPESPSAPVRLESPARTHEFFEAESFGRYLNLYGGPNTVVFANPNTSHVHAVLDEKAPLGFELVTFIPQTHPLFRAWETLLVQAAVNVEIFTQTLLVHRRSVIAPDARELALTFSQLRIGTQMEVQRGRGAKAINGIQMKVEIQGTLKNELVELPDSLTLYVPIYVGTEAHTIELDLLVNAVNDGKSIAISVTAGNLPEIRQQAFDEMLLKIKNAAPQAAFTYGEPHHDDWKYLPVKP